MAKAADTIETKAKADKGAKSGKPGRAAKADKPGIGARFVGYLRDVRSEMRRVVWPTRTEVRGMWTVVLVTLIVMSVGIAAFDYVVVQLLTLINRIGG